MEASKYIGGGLALGVVAQMFWYYKREEKIRDGAYFEKSVNLLKGYTPVTEIIGEPLEAKKIKLEDDSNFLNKEKAKLAIPVIGSKGHGTLYTWASKPENSEEWQVDRLDIEIEKPVSKKWTFYKKEDQTQRLNVTEDKPNS